jgi:hypothetical protein
LEKPGFLKAAEEVAQAKPAADAVKLAIRRKQSQNNLKHIALALHNYHDVNKRLPMPAIYDKDGKPLLSWRVAILPWLDQDNLHRKFKLEEPWDSPHNKKILDDTPMPSVYAAGEAAKNTTHYQAIVGKDTAFEPGKKVRFQDIRDGTSNTLGIVEAAQPVPWTKPEDVPYVAGQALPQLGGLFGGDFNTCLLDGSVRLFPKKIPEDMLRSLITRNGGEPVDWSRLPDNRPGLDQVPSPQELEQLNQKLQDALQQIQTQLKKEKDEIFRLKVAIQGPGKLDPKTLDLLQQHALLREALERDMTELDALRAKRAALEGQLRKKK